MPALGKLNRIVTIQAPVETPNGKGGFTRGWSVGVALWAEMIPLRGNEALAHLRERSTSLWKVTIRFRTDVNDKARIAYGSRILNIRSCDDPEGRREWLVMTAEEGVNT